MPSSFLMFYLVNQGHLLNDEYSQVGREYIHSTTQAYPFVYQKTISAISLVTHQ